MQATGFQRITTDLFMRTDSFLLGIFPRLTIWSLREKAKYSAGSFSGSRQESNPQSPTVISSVRYGKAKGKTSHIGNWE